MDRLGRTLPRFLRASLGADLPFRLVLLWRHWDEIVGEEVASLGRPLGRRKTTLRIGVEDVMAMQELTFHAPDILDAVHGFLEEPVFDTIQGELLGDRHGVDAERLTIPVREKPVKPARIGSLAGRFEDNPTIAEAYRKYVEFFKEQESGKQNRNPEEDT